MVSTIADFARDCRKQFCEPISDEFKPPATMFVNAGHAPRADIVAAFWDDEREELAVLDQHPQTMTTRYRGARTFTKWLRSYPIRVWIALVAHYTGLHFATDDDEEASAWLVCDRRQNEWWLVDGSTAVIAVSQQRKPGTFSS